MFNHSSFNITVTYIDMNANKFKDFNSGYEEIDIRLQQCEDTELESIFSRLSPDSYNLFKCLDKEQLKEMNLYGSFTHGVAGMLRVSVDMCTDSDECRDADLIRQYINKGLVFFGASHQEFYPSRFDSPID